MAEAARQDLKWMGLDWDESPWDGGSAGPYRQSERAALYEAALRRLAEVGRLFPCSLSRKDLEQLASAPHGNGSECPYPSVLRPKNLNPGWYDEFVTGRRSDLALRFAVKAETVVFTDRIYGPYSEQTLMEVGDFVVKRRDGVYAYQLAVVVDDAAMGVTEVVRGADLLASAGRQIQLFEALGVPVPQFAHVPLVLTARGEKLSKRDQGLTLRALREAGVRPRVLVGYLAYTLGLLPEPEPTTPGGLVSGFDWGRISREHCVLPDDLANLLVRG
jgi:glutamyl-tRNA synthetase